MRGSLKIATVRDVPINLHWTFLLLVAILGVAVYATSADVVLALYAVGMIGVVFVIVLLHELAHVATARRYGVPTREITLHPLGGISMMERMPEKPRHEAAVSAAGPAVNVVLALLFVPLVWHLHGASALYQVRLLRLDDLSLVQDLYWLNLIMAAFNLLPAFPLDGGRVLRATLAIRMSYVRATKVAADMGRFFGILFALGGFFWPNIFLLLIGVFVFFGAAAEERSATTMALFAKASVREAMRREFTTVPPDTAIATLVDISYRTHQMDLPVVADGAYIGLVDRNSLSSAVGDEGRTARDVMRTDTPRVAEDDDLAKAFRHFTSGRIKALPVVAPLDDGTAAAAAPDAAAEAGADTEDARVSWAHVPGPRHGSARIVGLLTIEDMERAYLYITQRDRVGRDTRIASPMDPTPKRRFPRAEGTRIRRTPDGDAEEWVPVGRR